MTMLQRNPVPVSHVAATGTARARAFWRAILARPAALLVLLSAVFGTLTVVVTPPLRGPDEMAHFLRAWGIAHGEILPSTEVGGRKGLYLPRSEEHTSELQSPMRRTYAGFALKKKQQ